MISKSILSKVSFYLQQQSLTVRNFSITARLLNVIKIQDNKDFEDKVKNSKVPVVVDFFATWCNPCRLLTPRIESVIAETKGKVMLAKVDIDEHTDLALDYQVQSVPVLMIMKDGKELQRIVGLQDTDKLKKWIDQAMEGEMDAKKIKV